MFDGVTFFNAENFIMFVVISIANDVLELLELFLGYLFESLWSA